MRDRDSWLKVKKEAELQPYALNSAFFFGSIFPCWNYNSDPEHNKKS